MADAFILGATRTAMGKKKGVLKDTHAMDVAVAALKGLQDQCKLDNEKLKQIDDVIMGCVSQTGEQGTNISRGSVLAAGWPIEVSGVSINRFCGSGQQAVNFAAQAVMSGAQDLVVGAGVENMTRVPMGVDMFMKEQMVMPPRSLISKYSLVPQGVSAEMIAEKWKFTRQQLDEFSLKSQQNAHKAISGGHLKKEITPIKVKVDQGTADAYKAHLEKFMSADEAAKHFAPADNGKVEVTFDTDEHPRPETTLEGLGKLKPVFKPTGVIHAGNSSGIVDGAAAVLIGSEKAAKELGLKPRARIVAMAVAGSEPVIMLTGPIPATQKCLKKAGLTIDQIDVIEINEAFAPVPLCTIQDTGMDPAKVNVNGGAIALGHPLGASGARLIGTLVNELERTNKRYGLATMCIGFGMGITTIIERV